MPCAARHKHRATMAERSFAEEVKKLRLGAGEVFRGEGILAVTKALLESGVAYVAGYQGAPISHLMDVLADAQDILAEHGIRFENSASEATAAATLAASVNYPLRGAVTFKSTVGTNVASDALANLASGGVTGGALIIVGEDYGEGSSIMQERSHAFAMKSQIWLLDPRPNLPCIVRAVKDGFELSEARHTPVMLQLRIRACHVHGQFVATDNRRPAFTLEEAMDTPQRDINRIVLPPASFLHEREKVEQRWPAAVRFIAERGLNEFFAEDADDIGIVVQGGLYNTLLRALERLGLADVYGRSTRAAVRDERDLPAGRRRGAALLRRQARGAAGRGGPAQLHRAEHRQHPAPGRPATAVHGKDLLPMAGEYTREVLHKGLRAFLGAAPLPGCRCRPARAPQGASRCSRWPGARAPAGLLHRLPGAADLHRDEAGRARAGRAPRQRRHRLPPVLDPAALQPRQHDHGLRPGRGRRGGLQHAVRPSARSA